MVCVPPLMVHAPPLMVHAPSLMVHAPPLMCMPTPYGAFPTPYGVCSTPYDVCPTPYGACPTPGVHAHPLWCIPHTVWCSHTCKPLIARDINRGTLFPAGITLLPVACDEGRIYRPVSRLQTTAVHTEPVSYDPVTTPVEQVTIPTNLDKQTNIQLKVEI